jgi:hypothetical protein
MGWDAAGGGGVTSVTVAPRTCLETQVQALVDDVPPHTQQLGEHFAERPAPSTIPELFQQLSASHELAVSDPHQTPAIKLTYRWRHLRCPGRSSLSLACTDCSTPSAPQRRGAAPGRGRIRPLHVRCQGA